MRLLRNRSTRAAGALLAVLVSAGSAGAADPTVIDGAPPSWSAQPSTVVDVRERIPVVVVQASAQLDPRPGLTRLGRELFADVERVLADMRVDVDDHGVIIDHLDG